MKVDAALFCRLFEPPVARVSLDWDVIRASNYPVVIEVLVAKADLATYYFPWYLSPDRREVFWSDPEAQPIAAVSWMQVRQAVSADKQLRVAEFARLYRTGGATVQVLAGCYDLGESRRLVLDGNHRIAALVETAAPFRLLSVTLHGPLIENVLPDLRHWSGVPST
jgi:hypothetical protein